MSTNPASKLHIRKLIYDLIADHPGLYTSRIAEYLNLPMDEIEQHVRYLQSRELIVAIDDQGISRYYINEEKAGLQKRRIIKTRRMIYDFIAKNPGLHISKIAELLQMSPPLVDYHVYTLSRDGLITVDKDEGYKRCYVSDSILSKDEKKIISALRRETPLRIVMYLLKHQKATYTDLYKNLNIPSNLLSYHLNKLLQLGVIDFADEGKGYKVKNRKEITMILRRYHLRSLVERFTDTWDYIE
ncbi:MAG: ArsR family transcriptional regulator [Candidatus Thermoplasmatota archaeon]